MKKPLVIAHRGASHVAPENTMAAYKKAIEMGADGIEIDVQLSKDGQLVVIHDQTLNRTSNKTGFVRDFTLKELKSFDFGSWFSPDFAGQTIPTLEEVLDLLSPTGMLLIIEIKNGPIFYDNIEKKVADMVSGYNMLDRAIISSFNHYSLVEIKKYCPKLATGALYAAGIYEPWEYAKRIGAEAIHPLFYNIVPQVMEGCLRNGIKVNPYTVDQPEYIKNVALAGVSGIITNVPDTALKVLNEMEVYHEA